MEPESNEHAKLDAVLDRLERVRRNGSGFIARCPAHEDGDPSLSLGIGTRWVIFKCHAGCSNDAVRAALGLTWADLVLDDSAPPKGRKRDWRAIELESYACAARLQNDPHTLERLRFGRGWAARALELLDVGWDGARLTLPVRDKDSKLHDVLRYMPFPTQGRKVLAGRGKSRLPWPAPEFIPNTRCLFMVEGEGTAISMLSIGLWAVALPGSVSKPTTSVTRPGSWQGAGWHKAWARRFERFPHIVLLPDCDVQGRTLMTAVGYDLVKAGINTHTVDLQPGTDDGRDVADILLSKTYDGPSRKAAKDILREIVAEKAGLLAA